VAWILTNPLTSGLLAAIISLAFYAGVLKIDNYRLTSQNGALVQAEKRRVELAASALRDNAAKISVDRKRSKQTQEEYARLQKTTNSLIADNKLLAADIKRLRESSAGSCGVSTETANPSISAAPRSTAIFGNSEELLVDLAGAADQVRNQLIACQAYVKGL
jgi:hypothetical protein